MPRQPVVHGHPIHAALSDLPAALIPSAFLASAVAGATGRPEHESGAVWAGRGALLAAVAAGGAGWWDWTTLPREHAAHRPATVHGILNSASLACVAGAALRRRQRTLLLGIATGALVVAGWIGGDLVYRLGWRVRPAEEIELVEPKLKERGLEELVESARSEIADFERTQTFLPPRG
jgi:uncharacterized membrane protein